MRHGWLLSSLAALALLGGCARNAAFERLAAEPLAAQPWAFGDHSGHLILTDHYRIHTTLNDPLYQHLLSRVLEAANGRARRLDPGAPAATASRMFECYVFSSRGQWENYTRARAGSNAPIYLQISSGGYCQDGVFAGYDLGRQRTLSVVAHEAWHQYSWFAFKDRLPSWLEEGLATQNEAFQWRGIDPVFTPWDNAPRLAALRQALRVERLWKLPDLLSTHAGRVIRLPAANIDSYYAQLWSLVLFLEQSPVYAPRLRTLLEDASAGRLIEALGGTSVTRREIDHFTERWNTTAGPVYFQKYICSDAALFEREYLAWVRTFVQSPGEAGR